MKYSLYTTTGRLVKRLFGIKDISLMKKNIKKRIGKLVYHQKYTADDIVALMQEMGMKEGSTVCIHSSMKEFYNYKGTARELIEKILKALGPEGTLMMPAFPPVKKAFEPGYVFPVKLFVFFELAATLDETLCDGAFIRCINPENMRDIAAERIPGDPRDPRMVIIRFGKFPGFDCRIQFFQHRIFVVTVCSAFPVGIPIDTDPEGTERGRHDLFR